MGSPPAACPCQPQSPKCQPHETNPGGRGSRGLRAACPNHTGDWYFTGDYPTPGGNRVVNRAFINWRQGKKERAY